MKYRDMKTKVFTLIEEAKKGELYSTSDADIEAKMSEVTNQVMFELARIKRIPRYVEIAVKAGDRITFADIAKECGLEVYQVDSVKGAAHEEKALGTVFKILEDGVFEVECSVYPERITANTSDTAYEFELSEDVLEVMPYGIAADLLKSDSSSAYGNIYAQRYENMKRSIDPRYKKTTFKYRGGVAI